MGVWGIEGLYIADAGVFPSVTNGNIYSPTMMVGEKAADLILLSSMALRPGETVADACTRTHASSLAKAHDRPAVAV